MGTFRHYQHFLHEHQLILNEVEPVVGKDVECSMCRQPINKHIDAFYSGNTFAADSVDFFMHKTCRELPKTFTHPMIPQHPLKLLKDRHKKFQFSLCNACNGGSQGFYYGADNKNFSVCLKCVKYELKSLEDRTRWHPGHNHPLTLVQSPALFLCHACNTTATDLSYICNKYCFWLHKSCVDAPITYQCKYHNQHTLTLAYSLPQEYRKFLWLCGICSKFINHSYWVYYCANCRFFAHVKCASTEMLSEDEADSGESNLMHFPAHDETSLHKMIQQCIMTKATDALLHNSATTAEPSPYINHWGHEHQLALRNKNAKTLTPYLNQKLEESELLICDGCTKPIFLVDEIFYECNSCNFFIHRSCFQFPEKMEHHLAGNLDEIFLVREVNELAFIVCKGCSVMDNGIFLSNGPTSFDIGCASLPIKIKHEGHRHPLNQLRYSVDNVFHACWLHYTEADEKEVIMYGCEKCEFYLHIRCALRPRLVKHRWDPHPLYLILFVQNVADHPHNFDYEFCSKQINPNSWFYHCNVCDLSFHTACIDPYYRLSNLKFGATNIHGNSHTHQHGLTVVLNIKMRKCKICGKDAFNTLVLECSPCKYLVHRGCFF
ncbi:uncharacterized protein LOC141686509 [Apium graveolens]|uniref:uncharacterized protein LOC141686509 n=1 Tax=Apium graveolens TaxID=4045 RepID=UPI003D796444